MWVRFLGKFDFNPAAMGGRVTISYKADQVENVTSECGAAALAAGKAKRTAAPRSQGMRDGGEDRRG